MFFTKTQTETLQSIRLQGADFIRTANLVPELEQKRGDPAHSAPSHADQMNLVVLTYEQLRQVYFRGARHEWYIFPWLQPPAQRRFPAPGASSFRTCTEASARRRSIP